MSGAAYWNQRIAQVGHTGWSDPAVYAYDQRLRLAAVRDAIAALPGGAHAAALDFGCGVGDFCALLAPRYGRVVGYDSADEVLRRARARHSAANIAYTGSLDEATGGRYDLVLSITVLQHVIDDDVLHCIVQRLAGCLAPQGRVVVLETFASGAASTATYLKRRDRRAFVDTFGAAGLALESDSGFYHPSEQPTPGFQAFRSRRLVRMLAALARRRVPGAASWLGRVASRAADLDAAYLQQPSSLTRLLVFAVASS